MSVSGFGRPTKCNELLIEEFCKHTLEGIPRATVCDLLGIHYTSFYNWKLRAEAASAQLLDGGAAPEETDLLYMTFFYRVRQSEAQFKAKVIKRMQRKGIPWQRDMAILERRDPDNWRKVDVVKQFAPGDDIPADGMYSDAELMRIIAMAESITQPEDQQ